MDHQDLGHCTIGLESTIIGFKNDSPILYRKGGIAIEAIEAIVGPLKTLLKAEDDPFKKLHLTLHQVMLLKHYCP